MRTLIKECLSFICHLEQQLYQSKLTISKLWYFIQTSISAVRTLRRISTAARYNKGGQLLTKLSNLISSEFNGDSRVEEIAKHVLEEASKPYMDMISSWISKGEVYDPICEFMVENKFPFEFKRSTASMMHSTKSGPLSNITSSVWEDCYCLRPQHIYLINEQTAEKVLTIGKYLNVIRECSISGGKGAVDESSTDLS